MLKKLEVDNFKSLVDFSMELSPMTVIIGNNATGKSAVLQAIDFLCNCVKEDFSIIIERRNWAVENVKSKLTSSNNKIVFRSSYEIKGANDEMVNLDWELIIQTSVGKNAMHLNSETITNLDTGEKILTYTMGKGGYIKGIDTTNKIPGTFEMQASVLKMVADNVSADPKIMLLKHFLENSTSFELLSPSEMRLSSRGEANNIGMSGKNLPSFIKRMNAEQKQSFMEKLGKVLGNRIERIDATTKGKPGWTQINVQEKYEERSISVNSKEMSDGILRVLAFIAISEIAKSDAILLLDEVENGINSNYAENLLSVLKDIYTESKHQLVLTTHSTVFLDYVEPDSIVYLYRNDMGETKAAKLFGTSIMKEQLQCMWPGEVILNMSPKEIMDKVLGNEGELA